MDEWLRIPLDRKGMQARRVCFALLVLALTMYLVGRAPVPQAGHTVALP